MNTPSGLRSPVPTTHGALREENLIGLDCAPAL